MSWSIVALISLLFGLLCVTLMELLRTKRTTVKAHSQAEIENARAELRKLLSNIEDRAERFQKMKESYNAKYHSKNSGNGGSTNGSTEGAGDSSGASK